MRLCLEEITCPWHGPGEEGEEGEVEEEEEERSGFAWVVRSIV